MAGVERLDHSILDRQLLRVLAGAEAAVPADFDDAGGRRGL
jgi:hypothetical protein